MKNLFLLGVIVALFYFVQTQFKDDDASSKNTLFPTSFKELELPNITVVKNGDIFYLRESNFPVSKELALTFTEYLKNIEIEGPISLDDEQFQEEFFIDFARANQKFSISKFNPLTGSFFIKKTSSGKISFYKAIDKNTSHKAYKTELEAAKNRYFLFRELFFLDKDKASDKKIFDIDKNLEVKSFSITSELGDISKVDLEAKQTQPQMPSKINFSYEAAEHFLSKLFSLKAQKLYTLFPNQLAAAKTKIIVKFNNEKAITIKLHHGYKGENGFFLSSDQLQFVYKLHVTDRKIFSYKYRNFWDLTFKLPESAQTNWKSQTSKEFEALLKSEGIQAIDIISDIDKFRAPKGSPFQSISIQGSRYDFYYYHQSFWIHDLSKEVFYRFERGDFPPLFERQR